jgi:long-chain acyl-CoA synthetase
MAYFEGSLPLYAVEKPPYTVEAPGYKPVEGETIPRRHPKAKDGLLERPSPDVATVFDLMRRGASKYPNEPAVGSRKLIKTHTEIKKVPKIVDGQTTEVDKEWTYFELSGYTYLTYVEYEALALQLGAGLRKLGLSPHDKVHLFATTAANWLAMSHACSSQSLTIVTAYDTLGESGVQHSLVQSAPSVVFTDPHLLRTIAKPLKSAPSVRYVVYNDDSHQTIPDSELQAFISSHPDLEVLSFSSLRALGEANSIAAVPPKPEDTYCIMYTSGSTGPPKGVPVTHAGFVAGVASLNAVVEDTVSYRDSILAYLPLAHIFELIVENLVLFLGATLGYGSPKTITDASMWRDCPGDLRALRPTVMVGVPQVWETVKKGIVSRVEASGGLTKAVFWAAYNAKSFLVRHGLPGQAAFDGIVFGKVRTMTGGRLRFIVNGASGLSEGTQFFLSMVLAPMIGGYGLTETCGNGALGSPLQWKPYAAGTIPAAVEAKLVSIPELKYFADSTPPQGEILLRGLPVLKEYYHNEEETAKAITADGWFRTGDIGEFTEDGHVRVIDRVKNLVKMQGGEYIALEKVEAVYRGGKYVHNIMVEADSEHTRPIAVVCPNEKVLAEKAAELGVDEAEMRTNKNVKAEVLRDLVEVGKQAGLGGMEIVSGVLIVDEEWTPANVSTLPFYFLRDTQC